YPGRPRLRRKKRRRGAGGIENRHGGKGRGVQKGRCNDLSGSGIFERRRDRTAGLSSRAKRLVTERLRGKRPYFVDRSKAVFFAKVWADRRSAAKQCFNLWVVNYWRGRAMMSGPGMPNPQRANR